MPLKCLCGFCDVFVSRKRYCDKCPNIPPGYEDTAREQSLAKQTAYNASESVKASKARYRASDLGQASKAKYRASDLGQDYQAAYQAAYQPAYQAAYQPAYRAKIAKELRTEAEAWQKEHGNGREALNDESAQAEVSDRLCFPRAKRAERLELVHARKASDLCV